MPGFLMGTGLCSRGLSERAQKSVPADGPPKQRPGLEAALLGSRAVSGGCLPGWLVWHWVYSSGCPGPGCGFSFGPLYFIHYVPHQEL